MVLMTANSFAENLAHVRERIERAASRSGHRADDVSLVAVTKTQPVEAMSAALEAGLVTFGENRVQEWDAKRPAFVGRGVKCHLIGHLQSNKARRAAAIFDRVDSLDSAGLAQKLDAAAGQDARRLGVLIEVHLSGEESKTGVAEPELDALADVVRGCANLQLRGLMAVPPYFENVEKVRPFFARLRGLRDRLAVRTGLRLDVLSMGMSHDFEVAIEEGATEVRVGTALFGARTTPA
jgi:PLP dependent protein